MDQRRAGGSSARLDSMQKAAVTDAEQLRKASRAGGRAFKTEKLRSEAANSPQRRGGKAIWQQLLSISTPPSPEVITTRSFPKLPENFGKLHINN